MRGIKAIIAGAGALSLASFGVFSGAEANAASAVRLSDNPDSASSIMVKHRVRNGLIKVKADISYTFEKCGLFPDSSNPSPVRNVLSFNNVPVDSYNIAEVSGELDLSDLSFGAAGTYEFCIHESGATNTEFDVDYDRETEYKIYVDVVNEKDSNGQYTGALKASLIPQALNMSTGEKGEIVFESEPDLTYIEVTHQVEGEKANFDQYFSYYLRLDDTRTLPIGTEITIEGVDEYYIDPATGERKANPKTIMTGDSGFVWMKKDQVMRLGVGGDKYRLPKGFVYYVAAGNRTDLERLYSVKFDQDNTGLMNVLKRTEGVPGIGASETQIADFNRMNTTLIRRSIGSGVSTGVSTKVLPFIAIAGIGIAAVFVTRYYLAKNKNNRA